MNDTKKYKYNQEDRVYFEMGEGLPKGYAKICGCASQEMPTIGRQWIVELEEKVGSYPFSCIVIFDVMIKDPPLPIPEKYNVL